MSRYFDEKNQPPEEPIVYTPEELTRKTKSHGIAFIIAYALIVVGIGLHFLPAAHPKPAAPPANPQITALTTEVQGYRTQVAALQDTVKSLRQIAAKAQEDAAQSVTMAETYGGRVDELNKTLNHIEINGTFPAKK